MGGTLKVSRESQTYEVIFKLDRGEEPWDGSQPFTLRRVRCAVGLLSVQSRAGLRLITQGKMEAEELNRRHVRACDTLSSVYKRSLVMFLCDEDALTYIEIIKQSSITL